jgi:hypothetical protein
LLRLASLFNRKGTIIAEKSSREKCLEGLAYGCMTSKEVCERLHPQMSLYSKEEKRRLMKATSMLLLRLSKSKLARAFRNGNALTYYININGEKRLFHGNEEREKIAKAQELRVQANQVVNLNEETVASIKRMHENMDEVFKSLGYEPDQLTRMHSVYGEIVELQSHVIVMLQRALNADDDNQRINVLDQSTKVLKKVGDLEALLSSGLVSKREEWKGLEDDIRSRDVELEQLKKEKQDRLEQQDKARKEGKAFPWTAGALKEARRLRTSGIMMESNNQSTYPSPIE